MIDVWVVTVTLLYFQYKWKGIKVLSGDRYNFTGPVQVLSNEVK